MSISQTKFLGATISNFSAAGGWNDNESSLTVYLVEDFTTSETRKYYMDYSDTSLYIYDDAQFTNEADLFNPPQLGNPLHFRFENFIFNGLLQNWTAERSTNGSYVYKVTLVDPRCILEATDVILDSFDNPISASICNILNVYGYYENITFGSARVNDGGMPWYRIKEAISVMTGTILSSYGQPLKYRGFAYGVIFDNDTFPTLPNYYRVNGQPSINLMDMIKQVCADASNDLIVKLRFIDGGFWIVISCVSRYLQQTIGKIDAFIDSVDNGTILNRRMVGLELRKEVNSSYLVGGNIESIVEVTNGELSDSNTINGQIAIAQNQCIWPYWGKDLFGNTILGIGLDYDHTISVDISHLSFNLLDSNYYKIDVGEMLSATAGQNMWMAYLQSRKPAIAEALNIAHIFDGAALLGQLENNEIPKPAKRKSPKKQAQEAANLMNKRNLQAHITNALFSLVSEYAQMYGEYFMVRLPDESNVSIIKGSLESETGKLTLNYDISDGGWIDSDVAPLGALPGFSNIFKTNNGKYECFVRFDMLSGINYDLSKIPAGDLFYSTNNDNEVLSAWVRADVDQIVFLNNDTLLDGRVVIKLAGPVYILQDTPAHFGGAELLGGLQKGENQGLVNLHNATRLVSLTDVEKNNLAKSVIEPGERSLLGLGNFAVMPNAAAIPLRSNTELYGPWLSIGPQGKTIFEQNNDLVPWNYNGVSNMNIIGQSLSDSRVSNQQTVETGEITVVGAPTLQIGDALILNGPNVTDINVSIGPDGVTTTYRMVTYTPEFGRLTKAFTDKFTRLTARQIDAQAKYVNIIKEFSKTQKILPLKSIVHNDFSKRGGPSNDFTGRGNPHLISQSPHGYMLGSTIPIFASGDTSIVRPSVGSQTLEEAITAFKAGDSEFLRTAAVSMDTLFRPFSTNINASGLPHFEVPTDAASTDISANQLNPLATGIIGQTNPSSDFAFVLNGQEASQSYFPSDEGFDSDDARLLGFRMPLFGVGWGYDIDGKPVPNANPSSPNNLFLSNYRNRSDMWKAGPVDIRWHNERKCWIAGASDPEKMAVIVQHYGALYGHPAYVARVVDSYNSGTLTYELPTVIPPLSGALDYIVFNIQEGGLTKHTIAVGEPVTLKRFDGQYYINENVRTLIKRI